MHDNDTQAHDEAMDPGSAPAVDGGQLAKLQTRVAELEAINAELQETVLREKAEIENQRRRLHRDLEQARRFANEKLLNELLPVYDGLESGLDRKSPRLNSSHYSASRMPSSA